MSDILIDSQNFGLAIINGDIQLTPTFGQLVRQRLHISLNAFRGEWGFNILFGVPYIANENNIIQILGKINQDVFDSYIREAILKVEGVNEITRYTSELNARTRTIDINFQCTLTDASDLSITEEINL